MRGVVRATAEELVVTPTGDQGSNRLATLAGANCLVVVGEDEPGLADGQSVTIVVLPDLGAHLLQQPTKPGTGFAQAKP